MAKTPKAPKAPLTPEQEKFVAAADPARAAGLQPSRVLKTFYPPSLEIAGVKVSRCGLGILGLLEAIDHPFIAMALQNKEVAVTIADIKRALYIFAFPREAKAAVATNKLDEVVDAWVMENEIPGDAVTKVPFILANMIQGGMGMVPGFDPEAEAPAAPASESGPANPLPQSPPATPA